jgi:hypothetical protein
MPAFIRTTFPRARRDVPGFSVSVHVIRVLISPLPATIRHGSRVLGIGLNLAAPIFGLPTPLTFRDAADRLVGVVAGASKEFVTIRAQAGKHTLQFTRKYSSLLGCGAAALIANRSESTISTSQACS